MLVVKRKRKLTPRELRMKHGNITKTNSTSQDLINGAEKQWKRYNDPLFKEEEFQEKVKEVFGIEQS